MSEAWLTANAVVGPPPFKPALTGIRFDNPPAPRASEALYQQYFRDHILTQLNNLVLNKVMDTSRDFYLPTAGRNRAPDISACGKDFVLDASAVVTIGDIKPRSDNGRFQDAHKGQVLTYLHLLLEKQRHRNEATGFLTDCYSIIFITLSHIDYQRVRVSCAYDLSKAENIGNRLLRALLDAAHPRLGFETIPGFRGLSMLQETVFSSIFSVVDNPHLVLKLCRDSSLVARETRALARLKGQAGVIQLEAQSPHSLLLSPMAKDTVEHKFRKPANPRGPIAQIVGTLQACHKAGVLHRDCRSSNILVGHDDALILADFGCSCLMDESPQAPMGAPVVFQSSSCLEGNVFRREDDLHILVRSLYALRAEVPDTIDRIELSNFWAERGMFIRMCNTCSSQ